MSLFIDELDGWTYTREEYYEYRAYEEMMEDVRQAELRNEQYFESRGYWDARAQEDYEMRMGVFL